MSEEELEDLLGLACCTYHKEIGRKANEYIKNMQKELQLKDKVIEEMAKFIANQDVDEEICSKIKNPTSEESDCYASIYVENACEECVNQYFINKVKGE